METIQDNKLVAVHFTLRNDQGDVLETTRDVLPFLYVHGHQQLPLGMEKALEGKRVGDKIDTIIEAEQGFGLRDEGLLQEVPRALLEGDAEIELGMQIAAETEDGPVAVRVVAIDTDIITVDGNHAFAGLRLHFDAEVRNVRDATQEELNGDF